MTPDGSVIISTEINTNGINQGVTSIKSQLGKLGGTVKKLGAAIGVAFGVRQIIQFGKEAIALGSDLQEVQNVVDVTFTTMNEQVNEFAKNAMYTAGLSETMAKQYVGTFGAMAKSFGFTEGQAYGMSTSLAQLSGDVASFYNLTQDAAYTKLKSVFTGETESLKDLGVVMTQTALDSFAMAKGFGKTTAQMTEQEKVALRYQFVMEQLTGASGDFLRTSDSWANQTRLLSLQFDSLKATIGQGLINALTPVIKVINTILSGLQVLANSFKQLTALLFGDASASSGGAAALEETAAGYDAVAESAAGAGKAADGYLSGLDEITKLSDSGGGGGASSAGGGGGGIVTPEIPVAEEMEDQVSSKIQALADTLKGLFEPLQKINLNPLRTSVNKLKTSFKKLGDTVGGALSWAWENVLVPLATWTIEEGLPALIDTLAEAFDFLNDILVALQPFANWLWENFLQPMGEWAGDVIIGTLETLSRLFEELGDWIEDTAQTAYDTVTKRWEEYAPWWEENVSTPVKEKSVEIDRALTEALKGPVYGIRDAWLTVSGWFTENVWNPLKQSAPEVDRAITDAFVGAWESIKLAWQNPKTWFTNNVATPVKDAFTGVKTWISNAFSAAKTSVTTTWGNVKTWFTENVSTPVSTAFTNVKTAITDAFSSAKSAVESAWGSVSTWFQTNVVDPVKGMFQTIWDTLTGLFSGDITFTDLVAAIGDKFKEFINNLIDGMNALLSKVVEPMNTLIDKIRWLEIFGRYPFTFLTPLTAPQIPYLAKGAVIPPNAPFMAMLGDQKHGTNIEAPLDTIKQAVAEVVGSGKGNVYHVSVNCEQRKLLEIIIDEAELWQGQTGNNPFELAY